MEEREEVRGRRGEEGRRDRGRKRRGRTSTIRFLFLNIPQTRHERECR